MSNAMECPRCKEIELYLVDEEIDDARDECVQTYECSGCGHVEVHVAGLPSWYLHCTEDDGQPDEAQEWYDYDPDC